MNSTPADSNRAPNDLKGGLARLTYSSFELMHSHDPHASSLREVWLSPLK